MLAQKRRVRVSLDIECYDDLDLENLNWREILDLQGDEEVYATIKEFDPFWYCDTLNTVSCYNIIIQYNVSVICDSFRSGTDPLVVSRLVGYITHVVAIQPNVWSCSWVYFRRLSCWC